MEFSWLPTLNVLSTYDSNLARSEGSCLLALRDLVTQIRTSALATLRIKGLLV